MFPNVGDKWYNLGAILLSICFVTPALPPLVAWLHTAGELWTAVRLASSRWPSWLLVQFECVSTAGKVQQVFQNIQQGWPSPTCFACINMPHCRGKYILSWASGCMFSLFLTTLAAQIGNFAECLQCLEKHTSPRLHNLQNQQGWGNAEKGHKRKSLQHGKN